ncbi:MAG: phosphoribosylformylglycinamidine synthase [Ruminococcaceae bacterium]|nr:phosphoribosylformylglycinamidine synthase [Oscillospiraceae bacterium]
MVYRIYVSKKEGLTLEADALLSDIKNLLGINSVKRVRILNRYDIENIDDELFDYVCRTILSEPQLDNYSANLDEFVLCGDTVFAVEFLPGQFDQRASSAAECIQIVSKGERPLVRSAKVYVLTGNISENEVNTIQKYIINPVESRLADMEMPRTLEFQTEIPTTVETLTGFIELSEEKLADFVEEKGLAMDLDDIKLCQDYFRLEKRDPTITEIRLLDTYWSDHCRHTTFLTTIDKVTFEDSFIQEAYDDYIADREKLGRTKPINLMDIGTLAAKVLRAEGKLDKLDISEEVNACTVKITINKDGKDENWLLLFKNETHNHPTEIEPFGGAATCVGGAIRDPLSGRSYVYAAMRVTGAADPTRPFSETLEGKLPQRIIVQTAADGYSSYGNQIGVTTGIVDELYHDGYAAKRMEIGAVIAAAPASYVRRECPVPEDVVILLGGRTGRDGCGGATGSSKSHDLSSLETCSAEVQKGNAPEERKIQRLFRNPKASLLIKRCNDFGAGGVSVAIGELADGLHVNLDAVPKKYEGLDGTELAISESQERMAVVVDPKDVQKFIELAKTENLEATVVATVTEKPYLIMTWKGNQIVNISREFLNSNGAEKHTNAVVEPQKKFEREIPSTLESGFKALVGDLNVCSKRGLSERFDSTIGAGTILMPFGGKTQTTPIQAMAHKISVEHGDTDTCSIMSWGFNPFIMEKDQFHGAYLSVVESVSKLMATGATFSDVYLTFQEYFPKLGNDETRWGMPLAALLGAYKAQIGLGIASIGGKDSMSGTFEDLDVPPTLCSFAVTTDKIDRIKSNEFKKTGSKVYLLRPEYNEFGVPTTESLKKIYDIVENTDFLSCYTPTYGGVAEAVFKMCLGNRLGFKFAIDDLDVIFGYLYGTFVIESDIPVKGAILLGETTDEALINDIDMKELIDIYENKLGDVFPCNIKTEKKNVPIFSFETEKIFTSNIKVSKPKVLIPVFPGTNCEYDTAKAFDRAGAESEIFVIKNLTVKDVGESIDTFVKKVKEIQIIFLPGGFSGGDEPDGSAKLITSFFRNPDVKNVVTDLIENRDGLMGGVCNGFQALIKLGLVPYGKIIVADEKSPTLTFNTIARHQSKLIRTRLCSNNSPWLKNAKVGTVYTAPISNGEGRLLASDELILSLAANGQIMTQYVDENGNPSFDIAVNPNGSAFCVEGLLSPDGRIFGKMGHAERIGKGLYKNVPGEYDLKLFESAVEYYK